jgi:hypothetical protein
MDDLNTRIALVALGLTAAVFCAGLVCGLLVTWVV